jgi:hypothetical protein
MKVTRVLVQLTVAILVSAVKKNACLCIFKSLLLMNSVTNEYLDYVYCMNMNNRDSNCEQLLGNIVSEKYSI